jgi:DNA-binding NtrC family response regulator
MQPSLQMAVFVRVELVSNLPCATTTKGRILLVDEDMRFRAVLAARLELLDLVVDHAFDYQSAIAKLIKNDYDLVLCDAKRTPGAMHSGHVARWVREMKLPLPVHFLEKPVRLGTIAELIRTHLPAVMRAAPKRPPSEARG